VTLSKPRRLLNGFQWLVLQYTSPGGWRDNASSESRVFVDCCLRVHRVVVRGNSFVRKRIMLSKLLLFFCKEGHSMNTVKTWRMCASMRERITKKTKQVGEEVVEGELFMGCSYTSDSL